MKFRYVGLIVQETLPLVRLDRSSSLERRVGYITGQWSARGGAVYADKTLCGVFVNIRSRTNWFLSRTLKVDSDISWCKLRHPYRARNWTFDENHFLVSS